MTKCRCVAPLRVARDHLALAGERERLDLKRGLLAHLALDRLGKRLAGFDHAARQRVELARRLARAAHHQHLAVAQDGRADREEWPVRIGSLVRHLCAIHSDRITVHC